MKNILFILMIGLLFCVSCKKVYTMEEDGGAIVKCRITGLESNGKGIETINSILTQRLQHITSGVNPSIQYNDSDSTYTIQLPGIINPKIELLFTHGEITISEIYNIREIYETANVELLDSLRTTFAPTNMISYTNDSRDLLLFSRKKDLLVIDSFINVNYTDFRFPSDMKLAWGKSSIDLMDLYMLRKSNSNLNLNKVFSKSRVQKSTYGNAFEIMIALNEEGDEQFANLTAINVGRSLAFCIDDQVLYAPNVNQRIEGGRISIMGDFTEGELMLLNSVLYSPIIKSDIEILDITIKEKNKN